MLKSVTKSQMTDKILCIRLRKRDRAAFEIVYDRYWKRLFLYSYKILEDQLVCEDIVQEVFISLWERSGEAKIENLEAYLIKATRYQVIKAIRGIKKLYGDSELLLHLSNDFSADIILEGREMSDHIDRCVEELPKRCQEVYRLSKVEDLSNREIAERLKISIRTVEAQLYKATRLIRKSISVLIIHIF